MAKISVKKETCPKCGATTVENIVRIARGEPIKVYVRCTKCGAFVARYRVSRYTSDKPYESLLQIVRTAYPDGRFATKELEAFSDEVNREFNETIQLVEKLPDIRRLEEIIGESEP